MAVDRSLLIVLTIVAGMTIALLLISKNEHRRFDRARDQLPVQHQQPAGADAAP
jgi:hypothetical protein